MEYLNATRRLLNRPYWRAAAWGLALVAAGGSFLAAILELQYEVPLRSVVRYFSRLHDDARDLAPLLRHPETLASLEGLTHAGSGINTGGLVYVQDGRLIFHPWLPEAAKDADRQAKTLEGQYASLVPKYFSARLDDLLSELLQPRNRRHLGRHGISPAQVEELQRQAQASDDPALRRALLWRTARLLQPFVPHHTARYGLALADKLRFYAANSPAGRYLGLFEVRQPAWLAAGGPDASPPGGRILVITRESDGSIQVEDQAASHRRRYRLQPLPHPSGLMLYRIAA